MAYEKSNVKKDVKGTEKLPQQPRVDIEKLSKDFNVLKIKLEESFVDIQDMRRMVNSMKIRKKAIELKLIEAKKIISNVIDRKTRDAFKEVLHLIDDCVKDFD